MIAATLLAADHLLFGLIRGSVMNQGICARFAGAAVFPGRALIDTLPLVRQVDVPPVVWQFGSAAATGADTPAATATPTASIASLP